VAGEARVWPVCLKFRPGTRYAPAHPQLRFKAWATVGNPALGIKRRKLVTKKVVVPTGNQFQSIIAAVRDVDKTFGTHGMGRDGADLLELLAYSGCRLHEAIELQWHDVDFGRYEQVEWWRWRHRLVQSAHAKLWTKSAHHTGWHVHARRN
jgi:integrase